MILSFYLLDVRATRRRTIIFWLIQRRACRRVDHSSSQHVAAIRPDEHGCVCGVLDGPRDFQKVGLRGLPNRFVYGATKAAVIGMTKAIAADFVKRGIRCNAICPGTVDTDLINKDSLFEGLMGGPDELAAWVTREIPLGRLQSAEEIAAAICWLLSEAASGVTGEALNVSAGQTMV